MLHIQADRPLLEDTMFSAPRKRLSAPDGERELTDEEFDAIGALKQSATDALEDGDLPTALSKSVAPAAKLRSTPCISRMHIVIFVITIRDIYFFISFVSGNDLREWPRYTEVLKIGNPTALLYVRRAEVLLKLKRPNASPSLRAH